MVKATKIVMHEVAKNVRSQLLDVDPCKAAQDMMMATLSRCVAYNRLSLIKVLLSKNALARQHI
eukprot:3365636-Karenia_brevis.AAC.1